jgi:hypothetical protein
VTTVAEFLTATTRETDMAAFPQHLTYTPYDRYSVLLPKRKLEHLPLQFSRFLIQISEAFGGYTIDRGVSGSWINQETGVEHVDDHIVIVVAIASGQTFFQTLKTLVATVAKELGEIAVFVAVAGGPTLFVYADLQGEPIEPSITTRGSGLIH